MFFSMGRLAYLLTGASIATASAQGSFSFEHYDERLFTPVEDLGALSTTEFTSLRHPLFPSYNVRIKKSDFCDGTVRYSQNISLPEFALMAACSTGHSRDISTS